MLLIILNITEYFANKILIFRFQTRVKSWNMIDSFSSKKGEIIEFVGSCIWYFQSEKLGSCDWEVPWQHESRIDHFKRHFNVYEMIKETILATPLRYGVYRENSNIADRASNFKITCCFWEYFYIGDNSCIHTNVLGYFFHIRCCCFSESFFEYNRLCIVKCK
jgi:hypothetical protein